MTNSGIPLRVAAVGTTVVDCSQLFMSQFQNYIGVDHVRGERTQSTLQRINLIGAQMDLISTE